MSNCIRDLYGVLGCAVHIVGEGGVKVEGNGTDEKLETTRLKNPGVVESGGGLLSSFLVVGGSAVWKF